MPDAYFAPAAVVAGILCGSAVIAASRNPTPLTWRWPVPPSLGEALRRAGWFETPERMLVLALVRSAVLAAIGLSSGLLFGPTAAAIIVSLPLAFLLVLSALHSPYLDAFHQPTGEGFLLSMLAVMGASYVWMRRLLRLEGLQRVRLVDA